MAWTPPKTDFAPGDILNAAEMNAIGENLDAIGGEWTLFTPTFTNLTVGTGGSASNIGHYINAGKLYVVRFRVVLGSSGASVGTNPTMTLPNSSTLAAASQNPSHALGNVAFTDEGTNTFFGLVAPDVSTTTAVRFRLFRADTTYVSVAQASATVPMTWASGDNIAAQFVYEAA